MPFQRVGHAIYIDFWRRKVDFGQKRAILTPLDRVRGLLILEYPVNMGHFLLRASIHIKWGAYISSFQQKVQNRSSYNITASVN